MQCGATPASVALLSALVCGGSQIVAQANSDALNRPALDEVNALRRNVGLGAPRIVAPTPFMERSDGRVQPVSQWDADPWLSTTRGSGNVSSSHRIQYDELPPPGSSELPPPHYGRVGQPAPATTYHPFTVDYLFFAPASLEGVGGRVTMHEVGGMYQHRFALHERFLLTARPFADVLFFAGPPSDSPRVPAQVYKVAIDLQGDIRINDVLGISLGLTPGLWSDFVVVSGDDLRLPARALATYRFMDGLFLAGGVIYTDNLRRNLLPTFGVIWDATDRLRFEIFYPRSRVAYKVLEKWQVYGVLERGGDTYNIRSAGFDEDFEYRDLRIMCGTQLDFWERFSLFGEVGAALDRKLRFEVQPHRDINSTFLLRAGFRF